jgi:hypothetical protein
MTWAAGPFDGVGLGLAVGVGVGEGVGLGVAAALEQADTASKTIALKETRMDRDREPLADMESTPAVGKY